MENSPLPINHLDAIPTELTDNKQPTLENKPGFSEKYLFIQGLKEGLKSVSNESRPIMTKRMTYLYNLTEEDARILSGEVVKISVHNESVEEQAIDVSGRIKQPVRVPVKKESEEGEGIDIPVKTYDKTWSGHRRHKQERLGHPKHDVVAAYQTIQENLPPAPVPKIPERPVVPPIQQPTKIKATESEEGEAQDIPVRAVDGTFAEQRRRKARQLGTGQDVLVAHRNIQEREQAEQPEPPVTDQQPSPTRTIPSLGSRGQRIYNEEADRGPGSLDTGGTRSTDTKEQVADDQQSFRRARRNQEEAMEPEQPTPKINIQNPFAILTRLKKIGGTAAVKNYLQSIINQSIQNPELAQYVTEAQNRLREL